MSRFMASDNCAFTTWQGLGKWRSWKFRLVMGGGMYLVSQQLTNYEDAVTGFQVTGGLAIALGVGFILSALGSYVLSRRLGLMDSAPAPTVK